MTHTLRIGRARATALVALLLAATQLTAASSAEAQARRDIGAPANLLECPIEQKPAKNGARPDAEVIKQLIRCKKGEMPVAAGDEGAVSVEVTSLQIGAPRPWSYRQDTGNGTLKTTVFPVKATYTERTYYRAATEVSEGWIRVFNCFVNSFGEWQIGSEETVRAGKTKRVPRS